MNRSKQKRQEAEVAASRSDFVWLTLQSAFFAAVLEGGILLLVLALGAIVHASPYLIWMLPLSYLTFFAVVALLIAVIGRISPRPVSPFGLAVVLGFLAALGPLCVLQPRGLHPLAILLLALGVATTVARTSRARSGSLLLPVRTLLVLWALVPIIAATQVGLRAVERGSRPASPAPSDAPNVLLLVLDTVRAMSLGLYGNSAPTTPEIERLARTGVVFDRAIATAPWTLPSHASMFTGRYPHELSTGWDTPLDEAFPTVAEVLSSRGYATAGFVGNLVYVSRNFGLDRGFQHYDDFPLSIGQLIVSSSPGRFVAAATWLRERIGYHDLLNRRSASDLNRALLAWLDERPRRPFFAFVNYFDAHEPYLPPADLARAFEARPGERPIRQWVTPFLGMHAEVREGWNLDEDQLANGHASYEAAIASLDREIGSLLRALERRGELGRTIVVITSDHGEQHGEHGLIGHVNSVYMPLVHVPLLISHPASVPAGVRVAAAASLVDLPATILDLTGSSGERAAVLPGRSLAAHWQRASDAAEGRPALSELEAGPVLRDWYPVAEGSLRSLVSDRYHYIESEKGTRELFDLLADPQEDRNLAGQPGTEPVIDDLRGRLDRTLR